MEQSAIQQISQCTLGVDKGVLVLKSRQEFQLATHLMATQASRRINLLTHDLDPWLFDQIDFIQAIKSLSLSRAEQVVRILLQDNQQVRQNGHRLLDLAQRLSSKISIHTPHPDDRDRLENYMVVDGTGYLLRNIHYKYSGTADFNDRLTSKKLNEQFELMWGQSEQDATLRRLHI